MIDGELLEKTVARKGYTAKEVAEGSNINVSTVYRAYEGKGISPRTADSIARFLKLTKKEAMAIFFAQFVAETRQE